MGPMLVIGVMLTGNLWLIVSRWLVLVLPAWLLIGQSIYCYVVRIVTPFLKVSRFAMPLGRTCMARVKRSRRPVCVRHTNSSLSAPTVVKLTGVHLRSDVCMSCAFVRLSDLGWYV